MYINISNNYKFIMYNHGIIICLEQSKNGKTIKNRTKHLINKLYIQYEIRHPISTTIGCFNSHMKALKNAIEIMKNDKNINYVIIGEEDIIIDYFSKSYKNLKKCLKKYNKYSDYILHLGGFPTFTENFSDIIHNYYDKHKIKSRIYLTTAYVVNLNVADNLLKILENSSKHIHYDAILSHCGIDQYLVRGNLVNQIQNYSSENTFINNILSTKIQTYFFTNINKISIIFINNWFSFLLISLISLNKNNCIVVILELLQFLNKYILRKLISRRFNQYLPKNFFTFTEILSLLRIYNLAKLFL